MQWNKLPNNEYLIENDDLICKFVFYIDKNSELTDKRTIVFLNSNTFSYNLAKNNPTLKNIILDLASQQIAESQKFVSVGKVKDSLSIEDFELPTSSVGKVFLKIKVSKYEDLEVQKTYLDEKKFSTKPIIEIKDKFQKICSLYDTLIGRTNHHYKNFTFSQLSSEFQTFCSKVRSSNEFVILFGENHTFFKLEADKKKINHKLSDHFSYFLYGIDSFLSRVSERTPEVFVKEFSYQDFIDQYLSPKPELAVGEANFGVTNSLVDLILGDSSILNSDYKVDREQIKEQTKLEIISKLRNKTEFAGDSYFKEIMTAPVEMATLDEVYDTVLNRLDIVSMSKVAAFCLLKMIPIQELKKIICRKIISSLSADQYVLIANFLEYVGDEASKEIGKALNKKLAQTKGKDGKTDLVLIDGANDLGTMMLEEMNSSMDREDKICLAVFALIPAAILLLKEIIENRDQILESIGEDLQIIKKAINKRFEYFFDASLLTFDILKSIKDGVIEATKSMLGATLLYFVNKLIQTILDACDSKEQDSANTTNNPFGKLDINDLLDTKLKDFYGIPDQLLEDFLKDLSNLLTVTEICMLLNGYRRDSILDQIYELVQQEKYKSLREFSGDFWMQFFKDLSKYTDQTLCQKALDDYSSSKKILIELCSDPTKLKEQLLENLYDGTVDLSDILEQAQRELADNKSKLENIVDLFNQENPDLFSCNDSVVPFEHESERHLSKIIVKNSIRPISKQFEYEAENFKRIFEDKSGIKENLKKFAEYSVTGSANMAAPIIQPDSGYIANKLRIQMQDSKNIVEVEGQNFVKINGSDVEYINVNDSISFISDTFTFNKEKENKNEFNIFKLVVKAISESNLGLDITQNNQNGYLGKVQESLLEQILRISADNGLFKRENYNKFTFSSTLKSKTSGDKNICEDSILSVTDFYMKYMDLFDNSKYKKQRCELGKEYVKWAILKIACEMFVSTLVMREVAKSFFVTSLFNENELFNEKSLFFNKILSSIQQDLSSSDQSDVVQILVNVQQKFGTPGDPTDPSSVLAKQLSEALTTIIIPKLIVRYVNAGIDIGQNVSNVNDVFFSSGSFDIVESGSPPQINDKLNLFKILSPNISDGPEEVTFYDSQRKYISTFNTRKSGLYLEQFYNVEHNKVHYQTIKTDQQRNIFDLFLNYCRNLEKDTIGFSDLFVPGYSQYPILSEGNQEIVQNDILLKHYETASSFAKIYNVRGVINSNSFIKYYQNQFAVQKNIEEFTNNVKILNESFLSSQQDQEDPGFLKNSYEYFVNNFLKQPLSTLFNKIQYGIRLVAYIDDKNFEKMPSDYKMLLSKLGYYDDGNGNKIIKIVLMESFEDFYKDMQNTTIFEVFYDVSSEYHISKQKEANLLEKLSKTPYFDAIFGAIRTQDMVSFAAIQNYELTEKTYKEVKKSFSSTIKTAKRNVLIQNSVLDREKGYIYPTLADSDSSGDSLMSIDTFQVVFKAMMTAGANVTDPTWKTPWFLPGPLTPIGIIAKSLEDKEEGSESSSDKFLEGNLDMEDKVCTDKK